MRKISCLQKCLFVLFGTALITAYPAPAQPPTGNVQYTPHTAEGFAMLMPAVIYAAPGIEANVYFDNLVLQAAPGRYLFDVDCAKGVQQNERWTWMPAARDAGDYPLQIEVRNLDDKIVATANSVVRVAKAEAGTGQTARLLCIGDSLTEGSAYTGELLKLGNGQENIRLTLLGTHQPDPKQPDNRHEGYGGWSYPSFLLSWIENPLPDARPNRKSSPFLFPGQGKPVFDFSRYVTEKLNGQTPDFITIMLGTNDVFGTNDETRSAAVERLIANAISLVEKIRPAVPNAKIAILPPVPPSASQDAFGTSYQSGPNRWEYRKSQLQADIRLTQVFGGREAENIYIVPAYVNLDCKNNYPVTEAPVNARNVTRLLRSSNGVHPDIPGYLQIADSIYAWIKSLS